MNAKRKSLFGYIFPAMGGLFVSYLYNVVDGIFIGQGIGTAALGAVNIGVPFITFAVAIAAMFPMGGATVVAIRMGRDDEVGANRAFMTAFSFTLFTSLILMLMGMIFSQQIVDISGARELSAEIREMSAEYLFYYSAFSVPMLMSTCLIVRMWGWTRVFAVMPGMICRWRFTFDRRWRKAFLQFYMDDL